MQKNISTEIKLDSPFIDSTEIIPKKNVTQANLFKGKSNSIDSNTDQNKILIDGDSRQHLQKDINKERSR